MLGFVGHLCITSLVDKSTGNKTAEDSIIRCEHQALLTALRIVSLGLNATQAIAMFYKQGQLSGGIPFDVARFSAEVLQANGASVRQEGFGLDFLGISIRPTRLICPTCQSD